MSRVVTVLCLMCLSATAARAVGRPDAATFWHPEIAPRGPVVIVVSLAEQRLYAYRNGVAIGISRISSGRPGYETPPGVYSILQKARTHYSNLYDDAPMPYMQRLSWGGVAMHAGVVPPRPASHGCVRLPQAFAARLFGVTRRGDVVVVSDQRVAPARLRHPAAVAPIDLQGQPTALEPSGRDTWLRPPAQPPAALNVVISLHDAAAYVLADGHLIGRAPVHAAAALDFSGSVLYVMQPDPAADADHRRGHIWSAYRIRGEGTVPEPATLAHRLALPPAFGQPLQAMLVTGTTVLVTDLPGAGGDAAATQRALLESAPASPRH